MNDEKIYYRDSLKIRNWWWIMMILIGPILVTLGIAGIYAGDATDLNLSLKISGFLFTLSIIVFWMIEKRYFLRCYVLPKSDGLVIKTGSLRKGKNIHWQNIHRIDLSLFEPTIYIDDQKPIRTVMQYEQNMKFRNKLKVLAKKHTIQLNLI